MIEIIYKEEKQEAKGNEELFSIPRNVRQIGLAGGDYRIYLEDYVYTFLGRLSEKAGEGQGVLAVFTGESRWAEGITYVFVRGALELEDAEAAADHIDFTEKMWTKLQEEQERYFPNQEVVGWFFAQPELPMEAADLFVRVHLKYFAGGEKILMLMDPTEKEDAVFVYANGFLAKQEGYYLFYERNPGMQAYMIEKVRGQPTETSQDVPDEAVKAFRKAVRGKGRKQRESQERQESTERPSVFSYAATACLVIAVLAVGGSFYRNYQEVHRLSEKAEAISAAAGGASVSAAGDGGTDVSEKKSNIQGRSLLEEMSGFFMDRKTDVEEVLSRVGGFFGAKEKKGETAAGNSESTGTQQGKDNSNPGSSDTDGRTAGASDKNGDAAENGSGSGSKDSGDSTGASAGIGNGSTGGSSETSAGSGTGTAGKNGETSAGTGSGAAGKSGGTSAGSESGAADKNSGTSAENGTGTAGKSSETSAGSGSGAAGKSGATSAVSGSGSTEKNDGTSAENGSGAAGENSGTSSGSGSGAAGKSGEASVASGSGSRGKSSGTSAGSGSGAAGKNSGTSAGNSSADSSGESSGSSKDSGTVNTSTGSSSGTGQGVSGGTSSGSSGNASGNGSETEDSSVQSIYREESDVRKAKRREELLEQEASEETSGSGAHATYVIRPGDTLYEISMEKYGSIDAISEICRLNGISREEIIYPGQVIVLP